MLDETEAINSAHPVNTGRHDLYKEAMRLVGEHHEKSQLVALVNWLLHRLEDNDPEYPMVQDAIAGAYAAYDGDPRVNGPDDFEAFAYAVRKHCYHGFGTDFRKRLTE